MRSLAAVALVLLAAVVGSMSCTDLPPIAGGVCGNGFIDGTNEDCDGSAGSGLTCGSAADPNNACRFVCGSAAAAPAVGCPLNQACGVDHRCRVGAGTFAPAPGPYAFQATQIAAGDVDGDGIDDLVGISDSALLTRFGSPTGDLAALASQPVRARTGDAAFGQLDDDRTLDVVIPTSVGLFTFLGGARDLRPFPYTSEDFGSGTVPVRVAKVDPLVSPIADFVLFVVGARANFSNSPDIGLCLDGSPALGSGFQCPGRDVTQLIGDRIPVGKTGFVEVNDFQAGAILGIKNDFTDEAVIAFRGDHAFQLWTTDASFGSDALTGITMAVVQPAIAIPLTATLGSDFVDNQHPPQALHGTVEIGSAGSVAFADFDGDGSPDVAIPVHIVGTEGRATGLDFDSFAVARGGGSGKLLDAVIPDTFTHPWQPGANTSGNRLLAISDLDGDGRPDLIFDGGIVVNKLNVPVIVSTPRLWTSAVVGDFNGDGRLDVAGIASPQPSVDVMLLTPDGHFNRFVVSTELPARSLDAGDFDGDFIEDVAVAVGDTAAGSAQDDEVEVAFGEPAGGPSPAVSMGTFGVTNPIVACQIDLDSNAPDEASDLLVTAVRDHEALGGAVLGDGSRRMLSPFLFLEPDKGVEGFDVALAAAIGQFDDDGHIDVATIVELIESIPGASAGSGSGSGSGSNSGGVPTVTVAGDPRIFVLSGLGNGDLRAGSGDVRNLAAFQFTNALYASGHFTDSPYDQVAGIDASDRQAHGRQPILVIASPPGSGSAWTASVLAKLPLPYAQESTHALHVADLDGDGFDELIVEMTGGSAGGIDAFVGSAGALAQPPIGSLEPIQPDGTCTGFTPLALGGSAARDLVASCETAHGPRLEVFAKAAGAWSPVQDLGVPTAGLLVSGDFNGDRLPDLAVVGTDGDVRVYLQCVAGEPCAGQLGSRAP